MTDEQQAIQAARNAIADVFEAEGQRSTADLIRKGDLDDMMEVEFAIKGAVLAAEGQFDDYQWRD